MGGASPQRSLLERIVVPIEEQIKGRLFGCQMCGQCVLSNTALVCPMGCPKGLRNGPCGGTLDGRCEVFPDKKCVWVHIYDRRRAEDYLKRVPPLQAPVDPRLVGTSSYINMFRGTDRPTRIPVPYLDLPDNPRELPVETGSALEAALKRDGFAITCEIRSPRTPKGLPRVRREVEAVAPWVDGINATSHAAGRASLPSGETARLILEAGAEPIPHLCGRDVDLPRFSREIEAHWESGVRTLLCLTGDWSPERLGGKDPRDDPWAGYFPMDSSQMVYDLRALRHSGKAPLMRKGYHPPEKAPRFFIGGAANPFSVPRETVFARLAQKAACGVDFIQTQAVLDVPGFLSWLEGLGETGLLRRFYLLPSVPVVLSARSLDILRGLPGVHVPEAVYQRLMKRADASGRFFDAGLELAEEVFQALRRAPGVDGVHLMIFGGEWGEVAHWVEHCRRELRQQAGQAGEPVGRVDQKAGS